MPAPDWVKKKKRGKYKKIWKDYTLYLRSHRKNPTVTEKEFMKILEGNKIKYLFQKGYFIEDFFFFIDFYINRHNIGIEVDEPYHNNKKQQSKDSHRTKLIEKNYNIKIYRFTKDEIFNNKPIVEEKLLFLLRR